MTKKQPLVLAHSQIETFIVEVRKQKVILDQDVGLLYGVHTRDVNKAVKNNPEKFLKGYVIELTSKELAPLRWKFSTANLSKRRTLPKAFTEKGLYMLATIIKSKQATKATLQIVETFSKVREFSKVAKSLAEENSPPKQQGLINKSGKLIA